MVNCMNSSFVDRNVDVVRDDLATQPPFHISTCQSLATGSQPPLKPRRSAANVKDGRLVKKANLNSKELKRASYNCQEISYSEVGRLVVIVLN